MKRPPPATPMFLTVWTPLALLALLAGCAASPQRSPISQPQPPVVTLPAPVATPAPVRTAPTSPFGQPDATVPSPAPVPSGPYGPTVAARFPDPAVVYTTPGLQSRRTDFTGSNELRAWLRDLLPQAGRAGGVTGQLITIGQSQRGEAMEALVLTRAASADAATLLASGKPTVLLIGQQHGDEPASAEALLVVARELAQGALRTVLDRINVIVLPRSNPDGAATGQAATANGIDLNLDHLLLRTPEARALAKLTSDYRPTVVLDLHEYAAVQPWLQKFSALPRQDGLLQYATTPNQPEFVTRAADEWFRGPINSAWRAQGLSSDWSFTTSTDATDNVVSMGGAAADSSRNVNGLKNAVSLVLESRGKGLGQQHIQRRVHTQVVAINAALRSTAAKASELMQLRSYVDRDVSSQACRAEAVVDADQALVLYDLAMINPQTGVDRTLTVDWQSSLTLRKTKTRLRPCGYWVSANAAAAVERLRLLGVKVFRIAQPGSVLGDQYTENLRAPTPALDPRAMARDTMQAPVRIEVELVRAAFDTPRDSYYVPMAQPLANLVMAALEPDTASSYFSHQLLLRLQDVGRVMGEPALSLEELR